jgi:NAD(P)-dependent dehydrogenase (short-subunit alcohol dehydrogenase family)
MTGSDRAAALALAKEGNRIVVSGRHGDNGYALEGELGVLDAEAVFIKADIRDDNDVQRLVDETVKRLKHATLFLGA